MADLIESARAILSVSERRMEAIANNVANLSTPGFKTQKLYSDVISEAGSLAPRTAELSRVDLAQGKMAMSGNPLDVAIGGAGFFKLVGRDGSVAFTRQGQFRLDGDGLLTGLHGMAVQGAEGGDIRLSSTDVQILADGTILQEGAAVAKLGLYQPAEGIQPKPMGGSLIALAEPQDVAEPQLHQKMVEASNVALADEMVALMEAMRGAEGGARLVQTYDDLMGKAINTFEQK